MFFFIILGCDSSLVFSDSCQIDDGSERKRYIKKLRDFFLFLLKWRFQKNNIFAEKAAPTFHININPSVYLFLRRFRLIKSLIKWSDIVDHYRRLSPLTDCVMCRMEYLILEFETFAIGYCLAGTKAES